MRNRKSRAGLTMLELLVSVPAATVLIAAMAMCVTIMMRANSQDETLFRSTYDLANAANQIASDIESAVSIVSSSATHIEFVVPDRDADGLPEQMRYEWGGATGTNAKKVLWKYNQSQLAVLFDDVGAFSLQTNTVLASSAVPNHLIAESAILKSIDAYPSGVFQEQVINAGSNIGEYLVPDVTGASTKWDLGAIRIMVKATDSSTDGVLRIRVMRGDTSTKLPIAPILAEVNIEKGRLGTNYQWLDIPIAPVSWQSAGAPLCVTLSSGGGAGDVASVQFIENGVGMPTNANMVTSSNGGTSWTTSGSTKGLRLYAVGFYDGYVGQRKFLSSVDLQMTSSRSTLQIIHTSVRTPNGPEIP
jgi:hypothetical protein